MSRHRIAAAGLALLLAACTAPPPRNLLLVTVDTLRADRLGCYGSELGLTPRIDALARRSIRFEAAYAVAPYTLPSIAALMTGAYPSEVGVADNRSRLASTAAPLARELRRSGFRTGAVVSSPVLARRSGLALGFERYDAKLPAGMGFARQRDAGATTDAALALLDRLAGDEARLFLWVHYQDPHGPYEPPEALRERYLAREREQPAAQRLLPVRPDSRGLGGIPRYQYQAPHREAAHYLAGYHGEVALVDREVGRLLDALASRGLRDATLVVFTSDHGEGLGENDYWFAHGEHLTDPLVRVPLLFHVPGREPGVRSDVVSLLDVAPSVLALLGVPAEPSLRGVDLFERGAPRRDARFATQPPAASVARVGLVEGQYKIVREQHAEGTRTRLYALPDERDDRAAREPERLAELGALLDAGPELLEGQAPAPLRALSDSEERALRALGYAE